jgi:hypothetical protein
VQQARALEELGGGARAGQSGHFASAGGALAEAASVGGRGRAPMASLQGLQQWLHGLREGAGGAAPSSQALPAATVVLLRAAEAVLCARLQVLL